MGAWHFATVLCRLATTHAARLEKEFLKVEPRLIENVVTGNIPAWTAAEQIDALSRVQASDAAGMGKQREQ